ncbi:MAG: AEC family transporter [Clostridiaceae bacterium]|nr:AEC family transporter [Clostridiaceae bacterium]
MGNINWQFLLSMLIIALGYVTKRIGLVTEKDGEGIAKVIFNFSLPALVINTFSTMKVETSLVWLPVINIMYGSLIAFLGFLLIKDTDRKKRGMLIYLLPGFNIGLFAYPLVEAIWGQEGLKHFGMIDMGNAIVLFGLCYILAGHFSSEEEKADFKSIAKKLIKSVPLVSYVLTLTLNLAGLRFPKIFVDICGILARANMPLSLLLLGIYLSFSFDKSYWKSMGKVLAIRYVTGAVIGTLLYLILPFAPLFKTTILIGMILPIGMAVIPYSIQFDYDRRFVGTTTNLTVIISFELMWLIVSLSPV